MIIRDIIQFEFDLSLINCKILSKMAFLSLLFFSTNALAGRASQETHLDTNENKINIRSEDKVQQLMDKIWSWQLEQFPEFATSVGHAEGNDRWTDLSAEAIQDRKQAIHAFLGKATKIDRTTLTSESQLDLDLLLYDLQLKHAGRQFPWEYLQINQMDGLQSSIVHTLKISPQSTAEDYENILSRLDGIPNLINQTIALLTQGLKTGITPPRITLRNLPLQIEMLLKKDPEESPLFAVFKNPSDKLSAKQVKSVKKRAKTALVRDVFPALLKFNRFLTETYLPNTRTEISLSSLPNGEAWYKHQLAYHIGLDLTPEEIHQTGLSEVKRIRKEMNRVIADAGFSGTFDEFVDYINSDQQFFYKTSADLLAAYRDLCKRLDAQMPRLFMTLPRLPYGVDKVESHLEQSAAAAYYFPGSIKASRPGMFYANTYDLKSRPNWLMQALALHEAVPGHHLQIAIAQEIENMHDLRKHQFWTAYVEGWALYAESLGKEIGFYQDPYSEFGQLSMEMIRAVRLVVDTGMHALGWSRQHAIDFFKEHSPTPEHDIIVEIDRYIVWPGQALAYKTGELKIKELRQLAEKSLGHAFDLRVFHDQLLNQGALPLSILERNTHHWIKQHQTIN